MALLDTNVLLDIATGDPTWAVWSLRATEAAAAEGPLYVNSVIYAELAVRYERAAEVDELIKAVGAEFAHIPPAAAFLAAKAFAGCRAAGGAKSGVLPDFFIGAHAAAVGIRLLTRDARRYRTYFPAVSLISPNLN